MASWVFHTMVAERLLKMIPFLDVKGFIVGNIAPDCNVENDDWTEFTPPRDVTHWMSGISKATADYEGFYEKYVKLGLPREQYAFYLGYYAHLITDAEFHVFMRDEERVCKCFERANSDKEIREKIAGKPEEFDTLKSALGRKRMDLEQMCIEADWLKAHPDNLFENVLLKVTEFSDYIDYLPKGAIARKIPVMQRGYNELTPPDTFVFCTAEELEKFAEETARAVYNRLTRHGGTKMKAMKYLQEAVNEARSLKDMIDAFRNMCAIPVGAEEEQLLFEAGVFSMPEIPEYRQGDIEECETAAEIVTAFMDMEEEEMDIDSLLFPETNTMFAFSLVRQFPDVEDEFFRIHMEVLFMPSEKNRNIHSAMWNDQTDGDFFDTIINSEAFKVASAEEMQEVRVYIDVT